MSQIAQQDHLYLDATNELDTPSKVAEELWGAIDQKFKNGTLLDTVIRHGKQCSKIISFYADNHGVLTNVDYDCGGEIYVLEKPA